MKKLFVAILAAELATFAVPIVRAEEDPLSQATLRTKYGGKKGVETKQVKLDEVEQGVWRLCIPKADLVGTNIESIDVLGGTAVAKKGEDGYFIGSNSDMGTFRLDNGNYINRRNMMTMFGMKTPCATFVGIVKGLPYEYSTVVETRDGVYEVFPRFHIMGIEFPAYEDLIVDFYELKGKDTDYGGMARTYRRWQLARGEVKPLRERIKNNPKLAYSSQALLFRFAHGGKGRPKDEKGRFIARDYTLDTELPMHIGWTFDDEIEAIKKLHELGVKQADFHDVGWNIRGHDGRYPQLFPVEPSLGGEAKLREAIKTAKELGYQISCHTNNTDSYKIADCWSEDFVSKKADGSLVKGGVWSGGQSYIPCPEALYNRFIESDYKRIADLGYNGLHHVDVISAVMPRTCHDPKHPLNRKQWSEWQLKATKHAHDVFGGFTSECGVDHVAKYLDFSLYVSHYPRYLPHDNPLVDDIVPVWQIAYHGIILSNPFWECIAYTLQPPEEAKVHRLKLIEYGGRPCFYGGTNLKNLDKVKIAYDDFQPVKYLQLEFMDSHKRLTDGVFLTVYGDGSEVVANYKDKEFAYKGRKVAPVDYLLIGPSP